MTRNLKILLSAAMALAAIGALSASAAQAHTPAKFHCHAEPCAFTLLPDSPVSGEHPSATAHQVIVIKNSVNETVSFTCETLDGFATSATKTTETLTFTNLEYTGCKAAGQLTTVRMNGCHYDVFPNETMNLQCPAGKSIEREITGTKCILTTGTQGPLAGVKFHNIGTTAAPPLPSNTHITLETKVPIFVSWDKLAGGVCPIDITKTPFTAEITTGNLTVTGFTDPAGTPADKHGNVRADIWWSSTVA